MAIWWTMDGSTFWYVSRFGTRPQASVEGRKVRQLFVDCYFPRQKDRINPPIPISTHLEIVVCNRMILTQTNGGHSFQRHVAFFSKVLHECISASLRQPQIDGRSPATVTMPFDSHLVVRKRLENLSELTNFGEEFRVDLRTSPVGKGLR